MPIDSFLYGFELFLNPLSIGLTLLGIIIGLLVGALPGLGPLMGIILLLNFQLDFVPLIGDLFADGENRDITYDFY